MEPVTLVLMSLFAIGAAAAVAMWEKVSSWAQESMLPWFRKHFPKIAPYVTEAFIMLDNVAVRLRNMAKRAWEAVRQYLLKQVITIRKKSNNQWVRVATEWLIQRLDQSKPQVVKRESETKLDWDELPADVRESAMRHGVYSKEVNVTEQKDRELGVYSH